MGFSTDAIHVGQEPDALTGSIVAPIYQTSTYVIEAMGKKQRLRLCPDQSSEQKSSRADHRKTRRWARLLRFPLPAWRRLIRVFRLLRPGDHVILSQAVYGGVFRLTTQLLVHFGLEFSYVDTSQLDKVSQAIKPNTRMVYVETPTNPTMIVTDIAAVSKLAHDLQTEVMVVVDNPFPEPLPPACHSRWARTSWFIP